VVPTLWLRIKPKIWVSSNAGSDQNVGFMAESKSKHCTLLICLGLALVVFAVFWPVSKCDFVNYDDLGYITTNQNIQHGITAESLKWALTTGHSSNWHPLTWISHMLDVQFYGLNPMGHHLTNLLFHIANAVLMFLLLRSMTKTLWPSAFIAALFALHPLRVESVAWVSERKDVLSTFFWILTVWAYVRYTQTSAQRVKWFVLALFVYALGLMSKPMVVTLPFVLLLVDVWPLRRVGVEQLRDFKRIAKLVVEKLPFVFLALASSVVTFFVQRKGGAVSSLQSLTLAERVENMFVAYARYVGKTFWPSRLSILYPHPGHWPWLVVIGCFVIVVAITVLVMQQLRARPYLAVGWFWFLGMLIPVIGLVQVGIQSMADRYSYLPIVGLFIATTWLAMEFVRVRSVLTTAAILAIGECCVVTSIQISYWRDSDALFSHAVAVTTDNYLAYNNLGYYLSNKGQTERAMENYKKALEIKPNYEDAHNNLGFCLAGQGKPLEAIEEYKKALGINRHLTEAHNNLGNALSNIGELDTAIHEYRIALEENPQHSDAHNNLGIALAMKGQVDEAIEHFKLAVKYKDNYGSAHSNLGNAYAVQGSELLTHGNTNAAQAKFDAAIAEYRECMRLNPGDPQAHNNLGNVLAQRDKLDDAIAEYHKAIDAKNENPEAHFNLGYALAKQGKRADAEAEYLIALKQKPDYRDAAAQLEVIRSGK
jgi:tetratricopeptide (TPR) repeat protein